MPRRHAAAASASGHPAAFANARAFDCEVDCDWLSQLPLSTVALTEVAFGASLPVLAVTLIAAARGHTQIAIGHLIVASIFDLFGVLGVAALVRPLPVSPSFAAADAFVVLAAGALLLPLLSGTWRLSRLKGAVLMLGYIGYLGFLAWREGLLHGLPGLS